MLKQFFLFCCVTVCIPEGSLAVKGPSMVTLDVTGSSIPPTASGTSATAAAGTASSINDNAFLPPVFGLSKRLPTLLSMRGGEVLEPETLDDVESILIKAGSESKLVVIDFSATWCGPCKMIAPLFKELSEGYSDVVFLKVDVDENPETAAKYSVSAMPTFVFIKGGEVVDRLMGANPARLQELIDEHK